MYDIQGDYPFRIFNGGFGGFCLRVFGMSEGFFSGLRDDMGVSSSSWGYPKLAGWFPLFWDPQNGFPPSSHGLVLRKWIAFKEPWNIEP